MPAAFPGRQCLTVQGQEGDVTCRWSCLFLPTHDRYLTTCGKLLGLFFIVSGRIAALLYTPLLLTTLIGEQVMMTVPTFLCYVCMGWGGGLVIHTPCLGPAHTAQ